MHLGLELVLARAWRIAGQWVTETEIIVPKEIRRPIRLSYVQMVVEFIDDGLLPTPDILRLVHVSPDVEIELNDTMFMGEDGVLQRGAIVLMPMPHYLDSELNGIRMMARGDS